MKKQKGERFIYLEEALFVNKYFTKNLVPPLSTLERNQNRINYIEQRNNVRSGYHVIRRNSKRCKLSH